MLDKKTLSKYLLAKYPQAHNIVNDKALRNFVIDLQHPSLKKSSPLSKVQFDDKIHVINNALGLHSFVSRVQGSKLKRKNEIRIATVFKSAPEEFLEMIVVIWSFERKGTQLFLTTDYWLNVVNLCIARVGQHR